MPSPASSTPPFATTTTLGASGGGGLTAESDPTTVWYDEGADVYYLQVAEFDDTGAFTGYELRDQAGAVYVPTGPNRPAGVPLVGGVDATVTINRVTNATLNTTAGNLAVHFIVIADAVTVDAVAWPINTGHTFDVRPDRTVPSIAFVADATGDVLVVQEAA